MALEKNVKDLTFNDLAKMARDESEAFATHIIGEAPTHRSGREVRYYENQSLVVFISGQKQGRFKSFTDESARGDLFDLYRYVRGGSNHDAVMGYKRYAGLDHTDPGQTVEIKRGPTPEEIKRQEEKDIADRMRKAQWIWEKASKTEGREEGLAYLRNRAITVEPDADVVRFRKLDRNSLLKMGVKEHEIPSTPVVSIMFKATNSKGEISAVQQILTSDGKKLRCDNPKKTNGSLIDASVKIGEPSEDGTLIIAEGPETTLSLHQATGLPCAITLGTSNYTNMDMPSWVKTLIVASDMDESGVGLGSALKAAQHWISNGVEKAGIALPRIASGDFNDVHQQSGDAAVERAVEKTFFPDRVRNDDALLVTPDAKVAFHAWMRTGVSTVVRIPPLQRGSAERSPINLDSVIDSSKKSVILVGKTGFSFDKDYVEKNRQDVQLIEIEDDAEGFLARAHTDGYVQEVVQLADIYAPQGVGTKEPMAITLRRRDADALIEAGHKAIAIRPTEAGNIDLSFMKGRKAIVAPVGKGTSIDAVLCDRLDDAGADTTRLTWQIFHPTPKGLSIVRDDIPKTYGAAEAVAEGWKGKAMGDLLLISELNKAQIHLSAPVEQNALRQNKTEKSR